MITEADVARAAIAWFQAGGWTVHQEVVLDPKLQDSHELGKARADIVPTRGQQVGVAEAKLGLGLAVFVQAKRWLPFADLVWIVVPDGQFTDERREAYDLARNWYGFGVLTVGDEGVIERVKPVAHRRRDDVLAVSLDPGQQTHGEAGTNHGGHWTPFNETRGKLATYVADHFRCTLKEALSSVGHHYRTMDEAEREMAKRIRKGNVPGVKFGWRQRLESVPVDRDLPPPTDESPGPRRMHDV